MFFLISVTIYLICITGFLIFVGIKLGDVQKKGGAEDEKKN